MGLEKAESENFFPTQVREYEARRKTLCDALDALGLPYTVPHGAYFIMVDARGIKVPEDYEFPEQVRDKPKDYRYVEKAFSDPLLAARSSLCALPTTQDMLVHGQDMRRSHHPSKRFLL